MLTIEDFYDSDGRILFNKHLIGVDNVTVANGDGVFINVQKGCKDFFGVSENEFIGQNAIQLENDGIFDVSATAEVLRSNSEVSLIQRTKGDKLLWVNSFPLFDSKNNIVKIINFSKDVTNPNQLIEITEQNNKLLNEYSKRQKENHIDFIAESENMKQLKSMIDSVLNIDTSVLLFGETGSGKGHIAKYIHDNSNNRNEPFIIINCGAIPANLMESELFGYEKGSFTGGLKEGKKGLIEMAGNGTILFDEIGDMPLDLQVKILHVLDSHEFMRVGSISKVNVKARLIFATNCDLNEMVNYGKFRKDLYYRISVFPIEVPPLRERKEDIPLLIRQFLNKFNNKYNRNVKLSNSDIDMLNKYKYPGNIRELMNIIERAVILSGINNKAVSNQNTMNYVDSHSSSFIQINKIYPIKTAVEEVEKQMLYLAKQKYHTTREMAQALMIDQSTIVKKMKKYFDD